MLNCLPKLSEHARYMCPQNIDRSHQEAVRGAEVAAVREGDREAGPAAPRQDRLADGLALRSRRVALLFGIYNRA